MKRWIKLLLLIPFFFQTNFAFGIEASSVCETCNQNPATPIIQIQNLCSTINQRCNDVPKEKRITCEANPLKDQATGILGCVTGVFKSAWDLASFVYEIGKFLLTTQVKALSAGAELALEAARDPIGTAKRLQDKSIKITRAQVMSVSQLSNYVAREFEVSRRKVGIFKAIPDMANRIIGPVVKTVWQEIEGFVSEQIHNFTCYNARAKSEMLCKAIADFVMPPAAIVGLLKGGGRKLLMQFPKMADGLRNIATAMAADIKLASKEAKLEREAHPEHRESRDDHDDKKDSRNSNSALANIGNASDKKRFLVDHFSTKNVTTESQNKSWRKFIESPGQNQKAVTIENINLKEMNDVIFKDEQYVTSITNLYKDMQMDRLRSLEKEIQKKNPNFKFHYFSDFKTVRVAYDDIPGVEVSKLLNQRLSQTNKEFADFAIKEKLVRETDNPTKWFKASSHKSDDWSNLVSRYSREHPDQFYIDGANDPKFKTWANERFSEAKNLQAKVMNDFKDTDMIVRTENGPIINRDLYEIMRKNKNPQIAKAEVERNFGLQKLTDHQYQELRDYFNRADNFAPGLRNTKREFATLAEATNGGISIDMIGLGADHIQATSGLALSKAKNIDELLVTSRKNEQILTEDINRRKAVIEAKFKEATGDPRAVVTCSGDGCKAFIPGRAVTKAESDRFVDAVTQGREEGRLRFSEVTRMDDPQMYDYVAKQGEDLEKLVRKKLVGSVEPSRLKGMNFSVKINTSNAETGTASIRASRVNSMTNSAKENERIEHAFREAVKELKMNYVPKL